MKTNERRRMKEEREEEGISENIKRYMNVFLRKEFMYVHIPCPTLGGYFRQLPKALRTLKPEKINQRQTAERSQISEFSARNPNFVVCTQRSIHPSIHPSAETDRQTERERERDRGRWIGKVRSSQRR
mgnify:CR=1 FL=1